MKRCAGREAKFEPPNVAALLVTVATRAPVLNLLSLFDLFLLVLLFSIQHFYSFRQNAPSQREMNVSFLCMVSGSYSL